MFILFNVIVSFAFGFICGIIGFPDLANLNSLATLLPSIAVGVRSMHDVGKSGQFILIPIYNFILTIADGEKGENKYGLDPKAEEIQSTAFANNYQKFLNFL